MRYSQQGVMKDARPWAKMFVAGAAAVTLAAGMFASVFASGHQLKCFQGTGDGDGSNGTCVLSADGQSAVVNTIDGDSNPNNAYGGVYYETTSLSGKYVGEVDAFSFDYVGTGAAGGSPRATLPIDKDGDGTTETYVSADVFGCTSGTSGAGTVDIVHDLTCIITENIGGPSYENWAAYVEANPTYRVTQGALPFIIVDQPGEFTLSNVVIGSQSHTLTKESCKNNGWKTAMTSDGKAFKNQGACVSYVQANEKAAFKRP